MRTRWFEDISATWIRQILYYSSLDYAISTCLFLFYTFLYLLQFSTWVKKGKKNEEVWYFNNSWSTSNFYLFTSSPFTLWFYFTICRYDFVWNFCHDCRHHFLTHRHDYHGLFYNFIITHCSLARCRKQAFSKNKKVELA